MTMLLKAILLVVICGLVGTSLADLSPKGCFFETLKLDALVDRCFDHVDNKTQHLDKEYALVGTNCIIKCKHGEGVSYRLCDSGGYWNGPVLKCVGKHDANRDVRRRQKKSFWWNRSSAPAPVRCNRPAAPSHGAVLGTVERYGNGEVVKYSCDTGFLLTAGSRERTCRRSGWTGEKPICTLATCHRPSAPSNGYISSGSGYTYGDVVRYYCNTGYTLTGASSRTCRYDYWTGTRPGCSRVTCGRLSDPYNGDVSQSGYDYGSLASYSCDTGYTLTGRSSRTCDSNGHWSGNTPSCTRISCGRPSAPAHGSISGYRYQFGDVIRYSCRSDYTLTGGSTSRRCTVSGSVGYWTGSKPSCVFSNTCRSNPCQHGATCVNGLNRYRCRCTHGWVGTNCEVDILPPVMNNCPANKTHYISTPAVTLNWTAPTFSDPTIRVSSNYRFNNATFPWGEFFIQYVATKPSNGLRSECLFTESIYPHPCEPLVAPDHGAVACNGWNGRFGEVCTVLCQQTRDLPLGEDIATVYVCGASGQWIPKMDTSACSERYLSESGGTERLQHHYYSGDCDDRRMEIGEKYIAILKTSPMREMCTSARWAASCVPQKAKVVCGNNK